MAQDQDGGWQASAQAWIDHLGGAGDQGRIDVLDAPMMAAAKDSGAVTALDVGCGEGRFCRMLRSIGITAVGLDPTPQLLSRARELDPDADYQSGRAEHLPFDDNSFDLVVSYLSLIDIPGHIRAIAEMARVLTPGGRLLVANLNPFVTAVPRNWPEGRGGWVHEAGARRYFAIDDYMAGRGYATSWAGIRITNYHRPLSDYMSAFLGAGLVLRAYEEPGYTGSDPDAADKFRRVPWFNMMIWDKPA
ncbi:class I SAM-dependent methyltransferase [Mameliella alba]|nr:class I SAM-dependent methyltransferase [Antarctobacter heliothermus]MBY6143701.1 class I SAM-dependent methyltransferase [Mameliella alba]MCA0952575.1 class I SAM-dependent methyltransferase [Mameliella alba]